MDMSLLSYSIFQQHLTQLTTLCPENSSLIESMTSQPPDFLLLASSAPLSSLQIQTCPKFCSQVVFSSPAISNARAHPVSWLCVLSLWWWHPNLYVQLWPFPWAPDSFIHSKCLADSSFWTSDSLVNAAYLKHNLWLLFLFSRLLHLQLDGSELFKPPVDHPWFSLCLSPIQPFGSSASNPLTSLYLDFYHSGSKHTFSCLDWSQGFLNGPSAPSLPPLPSTSCSCQGELFKDVNHILSFPCSKPFSDFIIR